MEEGDHVSDEPADSSNVRTCPYCHDGTVAKWERFCPTCGARNEQFIEGTVVDLKMRRIIKQRDDSKHRH